MARIKMPGGSNRLDLHQIENRAARLIADFQKTLELAGLSVPPIPPVPVEYLALTITELSVSGVKNLQSEGRRLSGLLDPERGEILYEESESPLRQNFTIAHELGHYFLHFLPSEQATGQLSMFNPDDFVEGDAVPFFRCDPDEVDETEGQESEETATGKNKSPDLNNAEVQARLAKIIRFKQRVSRYEWEANSFAAGLLMPRELVKWLNTKHGGDVAAMARELNVSPAALRYRLNGMGLRQDYRKGPRPRLQEEQPKPPEQNSLF